MVDIIEVPSGEIIEVTERQLKGLIHQGLVTYAKSYNNSEINGYVFYLPYKQDIFNYIDRTGIDNFQNFLR